MMPRTASLSDGCTPDRCRNSSLYGTCLFQRWYKFVVSKKETLRLFIVVQSIMFLSKKIYNITKIKFYQPGW